MGEAGIFVGGGAKMGEDANQCCRPFFEQKRQGGEIDLHWRGCGLQCCRVLVGGFASRRWHVLSGD
jgi:hypothetical protein